MEGISSEIQCNSFIRFEKLKTSYDFRLHLNVVCKCSVSLLVVFFSFCFASIPSSHLITLRLSRSFGLSGEVVNYSLTPFIRILLYLLHFR